MCKKNLGHRGPSSLCRCLAAFVSLVLLCCGGPMALAADSLEELREKLFRTEDAPRPEAAARDFQFESVLAFIDENISRDLTMDEAAANIAMSYNYFSRRFREVTGYSFPEYVNRRRIELSKAYLQDPSLKIADIAYKIGYRSPSTFSRAFKKLEGCYPTDYRKMQGVPAD